MVSPIPDNPLLDQQSKYLSSLSQTTKQCFFSNEIISPEERAKIWSEQAELGETLVNQHSWATPDERALKIIQYFGSQCDGIVEIGCGANAYWANQMHARGVDVMAFDFHLNQGGIINANTGQDGNGDNGDNDNGKLDKEDKERNIKKRKIEIINQKTFENGLIIRKGGPEMLQSDNMMNRVLFLCYPDEDVYEREDESNENTTEGKVCKEDNSDRNNDGPEQSEDHEENNAGSSHPTSMGAACLEEFNGNTIVLVGELFGDTLSMEQAPYGRSSSAALQERLFSEYHCILKATLTNWLHVRDTISVWKRSQCSTIVFQGEDDDSESEEVEFKHIPENERLHLDVAAPCAKHLL